MVCKRLYIYSYQLYTLCVASAYGSTCVSLIKSISHFIFQSDTSTNSSGHSDSNIFALLFVS